MYSAFVWLLKAAIVGGLLYCVIWRRVGIEMMLGVRDWYRDMVSGKAKVRSLRDWYRTVRGKAKVYPDSIIKK